MDSNDKLQKMEEEMNRFEAEIAHQVQSTSSLNGGFTYSSTSFIPSQLLHPPGTVLPMVAQPPPVPVYIPPPIAHIPTPSMPSATRTLLPQQPQSSQLPTVKTKETVASYVVKPVKVISAAPQMADPNKLLASRSKTVPLTSSSTAGSSLEPDIGDLDDDVKRALLAAEAGLVYSATNSSKSSVTSSQATATRVLPPPPKTNPQPPTPILAPTFSANAASQTPAPPPVLPIPINLPPPPAPVGYRSAAASQAALADRQASSSGGKKKRFLRCAGGIKWEDPTLAEWDSDDFRIFCGDLGNEIDDDKLVRAFNRYPSFQKARVVRDKRSNKSRGYGFVSFSDPADFTRAMREMNGKYVGNRPIKLKRSDWRNRQMETIRKKEKEKKKLGLKQ